MNRYLIEQMAIYSSYHRDPRTRLTHFAGVPSIVFALLLPMALVRFGDAGGYTISLATVITAAAAIYWIVLDVPVGLVTALLYAPLAFIAERLADRGADTVWILFAAFFIGGWILQLIGHAVFEHRRPALLDNLLQVLIAPLFLVAEVLFALGLRRGLSRAVEARWRDYA